MSAANKAADVSKQRSTPLNYRIEKNIAFSAHRQSVLTLLKNTAMHYFQDELQISKCQDFSKALTF